MKRRLFIVAGGCFLVVAIVAGILVFSLLRRSAIPPKITKEAGFVLFYPNGDPSIMINKSTFKYDKSIDQFSFIAMFQGTKITFGEQLTPETFYANSEYYSNLITKMGGYYTFQNTDGTVNLTQTSKLGHQAGVLNSKGTLVFIESSSNLSDSDWREIFDSLSYVQSK